MKSRADTANRIVLLLLGLLLVLAGGLGLAAGLGDFGESSVTTPVLPENVHTFPERNSWFWWAVGGVALLVAILAVLWLIAQLRSHRVSSLDCTTDAREGYTTLQAGALTRAVEDEARGIAAVTGASARVRDHPRLGLSVAVEMTDSADIDRLRGHLENDMVAHVRQAVGDPEFPVDIELRPDVRRTPARTVS
jgi:hypothetical protein